MEMLEGASSIIKADEEESLNTVNLKPKQEQFDESKDADWTRKIDLSLDSLARRFQSSPDAKRLLNNHSSSSPGISDFRAEFIKSCQQSRRKLFFFKSLLINCFSKIVSDRYDFRCV